MFLIKNKNKHFSAYKLGLFSTMTTADMLSSTEDTTPTLNTLRVDTDQPPARVLLGAAQVKHGVGIFKIAQTSASIDLEL